MSRYYWTKISKEPKKYDDYLVITKGGCMDSAFFDGKWHKSHYDGSSEFTHWRHFPSYPKTVYERIRDIVEWILMPFGVVVISIMIAVFLMWDILKNGNKY